MKNKKIKTEAKFAFFLILGIFILGMISCKSNKTIPEIKIMVDPRVELMSIIFRLAGNGEYNHPGVLPYVADIEKHFDPFKKHSAVEMAKNLSKSAGIGFDAPMSGSYDLKDWDIPSVKLEEYLNKELMDRGSAQNDDIDEKAAMKKLGFVIGQWKGEGWMLIGPDQRFPFSVTELYSYRCNGLVVDGEGRFRPQGVPEDAETRVTYGLGMIYFDRQSGEYRMWHYGGTGRGFVFTQKIEIDVEQQALHYTNKDARGETYRFGFAIDDKGILTARSERQRPDGTWYISMEFQMRRVE